MARKIDITGQRFGRWLVLCENGRTKGGEAIWLCRCDCGVEATVVGKSLRSGHSASCGCLKRDVAASHQLYRHRLYDAWRMMLDRCTNPNSKAYPRYGGRGISICERWAHRENGLANFIADMDPTYQDGLSLERQNNDLGYSPENCTWATRVAQSRNRRSNRLVTHAGHTRTLAEWAEKTGVPYATLQSRLDRGWSADRALTERVQSQRRTAHP